MTNEECLDKALEYTGITNNCCAKVDRCIYSDRCYLHGEVSKCEEHTVFKKIKSALEREPVRRGKWIDIDSQTYTWKVRCDQCGHDRSMMSTRGRYPKYCENCGAKMYEEVEEA